MPVPTSRRAGLSLLVVASAGFFLSVDLTIVNVALPDIQDDLGATSGGLAMVIDAYNVTLASLLLLGAGLGARFGQRTAFLAGIAVFTVATLLAGLAQSTGQLVLWRAVMGIGAALLLAPALALTAQIFEPGRRPRALATWASASAIGLAAGPMIGGLVVSAAGWRWSFLLNVPFTAAILVVGAAVLPRHGPRTDEPIDAGGAVLSVVGLFVLVSAVIEAPHRGWTDPLIVAGLIAGAAILAGYVWWELRRDHPMIDLRVFRRRGIRGASVALFLSYIGFSGGLFLCTWQLEQVMGLPAWTVGWLVAPFAVVLWLATRVAARLVTRIGLGRTVVSGVAPIVAGYVLLAAVAPLGQPLLVTFGLCLLAAGVGLVTPMSAVISVNDLPDAMVSTASGLSMVSRFLGAAIGVAVLASVVAGVGGVAEAGEAGVWAAYAAGALACAALGAWVLRLLWHWQPQSAPDAARLG